MISIRYILGFSLILQLVSGKAVSEDEGSVNLVPDDVSTYNVTSGGSNVVDVGAPVTDDGRLWTDDGGVLSYRPPQST